MTATKRWSKADGKVLGVGVVACAACCAGPILGFFAAASIATVLGVLILGVAGLAIAVVAAVALLRRHREREVVEPVAVELGRKSHD